jgi:DNA-binding CsgD family transcriptional regulator
MYSRHRELGQLVDILGHPARGPSSLVVIEGPAGAGRTRLLRELVVAARSRHCVVIEHSGWMAPADVRRMTAELHTMAERTGTAGQVLVAWDDARWTEPCPLPALDAAAQPTVVVWALTRRTGDGPPVPVAWEASDVTTIELGPLPEAAVAHVVADLLHATPSDDLLTLAAAAAGNPADVVELVNGLREEGLIDIDAGVARLRLATLPARTRLRVRRRLKWMSTEARHFVQVASAMGVSFHLSDIADLLCETVAGLLPAVEEALASGLLVCRGEHLAFSHELVRSVVADSLPTSVRNALRLEVDRLTLHRTAPAVVPVATPYDRPAPECITTGWDSLSDTEQTIARLINQALTNRQIASRVFLSPHTVNYHLRQIFRKLGIHSRVELVRLMQARPPGAAGRDVPAAS